MVRYSVQPRDWIFANGIIIEYQKITKIPKTSQQNKSDTVTNENDKEIPQEISKER